MIISIVSGKGGSGKTALAAGLILELTAQEFRVLGVDMDVETPQLVRRVGKAEKLKEKGKITRKIAWIDEEKCVGCGLCYKKCRLGAILWKPGMKAKIVPDACAGCMLCKYFCPYGAIVEREIEIGDYRWWSVGGKTELLEFETFPEVEETSAAIRFGLSMVKNVASSYDFVIMDAPPGTRAGVLKIIDASDVLIVVGEASKPGISNLRGIFELIRERRKLHMLVFNKHLEGFGLEYPEAPEKLCDVAIEFKPELLGTPGIIRNRKVIECVLRLWEQKGAAEKVF